MCDVGQKIPEFKAQTGDKQPFSEKDLMGHKTVLYFYPKDDTPGCTIEASDFTKLSPEFVKKGYRVVGVSADSCESHAKFMEKYKLTITLLSDADHSMCEAFGVWQNKGAFGIGIVRTTFVLDEQGIVTRVYKRVKADGHAAQVLADL